MPPRPQLAPAEEQAAPQRGRRTGQRLALALMVLSLVYALFAGLHTVFDLDMGWHLATGCYVVQHHTVPSTDILSYTSPGQEWLYPPFAGVLLYGIFSAWGYAGLTWFCALALLAMVACLLQRPSRQESAFAAALAILAVPDLALRANPRADVFTTLFFAFYVALLWSYHRSSTFLPDTATHTRSTSERLWILPLLMLFWVNLHPGFVAGLGMLCAYLLLEALDLLVPTHRNAALLRLKQAWPPLAATVFVTVLNPYGVKIFKSALMLSGLHQSNQPDSGPFVLELRGIPLSLASLSQSFDLRNPSSSYWWLAFATVLAIAAALWRRYLGAALLLSAALYVSTHHLRFKSLFAIIAVVVGSTILGKVFEAAGQARAKIPVLQLRAVGFLPMILAAALSILTCVRITDLVSDHYYLASSSQSLFGVGESQDFPERAAAFIQREHLAGNIFQLYNLGGFTAWRLGPRYQDFIDGRNVSPAVWAESQKLQSASLDSPLWQEEADRRNINILFFSLTRFYGLSDQNLLSLCNSQQWRPVYMDEVSIVLLRNRPENTPWIDTYRVDCNTQTFVAPQHASRGELSNFYANSAAILLLLGRVREAQDDLNRAVALSPEAPTIHLALARLYEGLRQPGAAEREFATALSLKRDDPLYWFELGRFYYSHGRSSDARPYVMTATQLTIVPPVSEYLYLGRIDLELRQPQEALNDFSAAEKAMAGRQDWDPEFFAQIAEGRAAAYFATGQPQRALAFLQEAVRRTPRNAIRWKELGDLYQTLQQPQLAEQAHEQAAALSQ